MEINLEAKTTNEKLVKAYLESNVSSELANKINNGKKTLNGCWNYITAEARKRAVNNCACIEDKEVYGWAVHYFEEDSIKENEIKPVQHTVETKPKAEPKAEKKSNSVNKMQLNLFDLNLGENNDKETKKNNK